MTTVELFAGIGGFRIAADQCSLKTTWANDKDALACAVYRANFGLDVIREGDVSERLDEIPVHDVLTGGFPCQPFSNAGKKRGISDARGTLFQVIVDVLKARRPAYFVLENVKRLLTMEAGYHFATILDALSSLDYRIEWRLLNAVHFGLPQNRERVFICGTRSDVRPPDLYLALASKEELTQLPSRRIEMLREPASWAPIENHGRSFPPWGLAANRRFLGARLTEFGDKQPRRFLKAILEESVPEAFDFTATTRERMKYSTRVKRFVHGVEILMNQKGGARMGYTVFGINGVAPTLTATQSRHYERYAIAGRYRRLTNVEYARIQGFSDTHCDAASTYAQYALYGNAVPPPMAAWVLKQVMQPERAGGIESLQHQPSLLAYGGPEP